VRTMSETAAGGGTIKIHVKHNLGRNATLYVNEDDKIATIKAKAAPVIGLLPTQHDLYLTGKEEPLDVTRTVGFYNITTGTTLRVVKNPTT